MWQYACFLIFIHLVHLILCLSLHVWPMASPISLRHSSMLINLDPLLSFLYRVQTFMDIVYLMHNISFIIVIAFPSITLLITLMNHLVRMLLSISSCAYQCIHDQHLLQFLCVFQLIMSINSNSPSLIPLSSPRIHGHRLLDAYIFIHSSSSVSIDTSTGYIDESLSENGSNMEDAWLSSWCRSHLQERMTLLLLL